MAPRPRSARAALLLPLWLIAAGATARAAAPADITLGGAWAEPQGPLGAVATAAPAFWIAAAAPPDSGRPLGLRLEGGFTSLAVGDELPLGAPGGGSTTSWATLTQRLGWLTVGPELGFPLARARVHVHATAGGGHVSVHPSVRSVGVAGEHFPESFSSPPRRLTFAWTAGGGVRIPIRGGLGFDLGGTMVGFGRAPVPIQPLLVPGAYGRETFAVANQHASLVQVRVGLAYTPAPPRPAAYGPPAPKPKRERPLGKPRPAPADTTRRDPRS